ncbi:MAG: hypothetical protein ACI8TQ_000801 [Planctomycetota bacterium]|jgi:hypothetical protein
MKPSQPGLLRRLQFFLERLVQRGILAQLCLMAGLIAVVAFLGGVAAWALTSNFDSLPVAVWWSFLRLTDPGYLGDDEGAMLRIVATIVTVLGYVLFMGSLIAIMTQWLASTIRKLERGLTPIAMENHFVILGWTNRTAEIIKKLLSAAGRLERFFAQRGGTGKLRIVVLADEVDAERRQELREKLGEDWNESQVFLRSGSSLQKEHLARLDLSRASVVMIPGADFELGGAEQNDTRVVKTLLNLDSLFDEESGSKMPRIVAELFDPKKASIAHRSISTPCEIIAGDRLISRLLSQSLRHSGVGTVLLSLLTHREGNGIYLRAFDQFVGFTPRALIDLFPKAVVMGVVSQENSSTAVHLNPAQDLTIKPGDRLIFLAEKFDECQPSDNVPTEPANEPVGTLPSGSEPDVRRFLILGWNFKVPTLMTELLESTTGRFEITIMSKIDMSERDRALAHLELTERLTVQNVVGDYSLEQDLCKLEPHNFDHALFLASGRMKSTEDSDARTVMGMLLLRSLLEAHEESPEILVELLDPENATFLEEGADVVFVSPRMLSHLLAHVGLLPELNAVFDDLICSGGSEIVLRRASDLGLDSKDVTFADIQKAAASLGCIGLGFYIAPMAKTPRRIELNPERTSGRMLIKDDRIILLRTE